ncbi:MAG: ATP-binding protein, partial [Xanthobacteraceae bacterium]
MSRPKALIAWSSGKDSAWALHEVRRAGEFDVVGALTTITDAFGRVSIHGLRQELLAAQLDAAGLAPVTVRIPYPCPNEIYEREMAAAMGQAKA